jgi:hypothetical protein
MSTESDRYRAKNSSFASWTMLLVLSLFLLLLIYDSGVTIVWAITFSIVLVGIGVYRVRTFQSKAFDLIKNGSTLSIYNYEAQRKTLMLFLALIIAAFVAPLLLARVLGTTIWLGSIIGVMDGWVGQLLVYNFYLRTWEKRNHGTIYSMQVWEGSKVTHSGLSFEKDGEKR